MHDVFKQLETVVEWVKYHCISGLFAETREAHALYQYAQTVDVLEVDMPTFDDSYSDVDCTLSIASLVVNISLWLGRWSSMDNWL